eukprot:1609182-Pleurochrysis_carterae.AAC.2
MRATDGARRQATSEQGSTVLGGSRMRRAHNCNGRASPLQASKGMRALSAGEAFEGGKPLGD